MYECNRNGSKEIARIYVGVILPAYMCVCLSICKYIWIWRQLHGGTIFF